MPTKISESLVLVRKQNGFVVIPADTPLTRLNYFDGKFLRASDLKAEQDYVAQLVRQSNQAGGSGVAHGFDLTLGGGDQIVIGPGLAIDSEGRVLLLPQGTSIGVQELIEKSRDLQRLFGKTNVSRSDGFETCELTSEAPPDHIAQGGDLYVIVISSAEAFCGEEDVYGKLCEEACATSTDRPFVVEGLIVRAIPLVLQTTLPKPKVLALTGTHLRSQVAAAYYEDERRRIASLISKFGLEQETWCLGADTSAGNGVPIGVIARAGSTTVFLDPWIARRELMDTSPRRYWQWRMMMRPWDVFLAQVLQFQCQLHDLFRTIPAPGGEVEPCGGARGAIDEAANAISELRKYYQATAERFTALRVNLDEAMTFRGGLSRLADLNNKLVNVGQALADLPKDRLLIRGGIVELPSAGYLPVVASPMSTINEQVRKMMGEGVDLRFCVVRPDFVAHALEEAQHMERISLLQGLDNPADKPQVDILVPNGEILNQRRLSPGRGFEADVDVSLGVFGVSTAATHLAFIPKSEDLSFQGASRLETLPSGGGAAYLSCEYQSKLREFSTVTNTEVNLNVARVPPLAAGRENVLASLAASRESVLAFTPPRIGLWVSLRCEGNVFEMGRGDTTNFNARAIVAVSAGNNPPVDIQFDGTLEIIEQAQTAGTVKSLKVHIENAQFSLTGQVFGNAGPKNKIPVELDAEVKLTGGTAIQILLDTQLGQIELTANWEKQPLELTAAVTIVGDPAGRHQDTPLVDASLRENSDVLSDKNSRHKQALDALEVIATALRDANFADAKGRLLFPPPPKPVDELLMRGTMDWVMFHRRRNKICQIEVPQPVPAPRRSYAVFDLKLADQKQVGKIREALRSSSPQAVEFLQKLGFKPVDIVEFEAGVPALVSAPGQIQSDWQAKNPGNILLYGAIGSTGPAAAEGETLAERRLDRVEQVVSSISQPAPGSLFEAIPTIPALFSIQGTDGAIVLITTEVPKVCHAVFRAKSRDVFDLVVGRVRSGLSLDPPTQFGLIPLGETLFKADSADEFEPQDIVTKWNAQGPADPVHVAVVSSGAPAPAVPIFLEQAKKIQQAIGEAVEGPFSLPTTLPLPGTCPAISIIAPGRNPPPPAGPPPPVVITHGVVEQPQPSPPAGPAPPDAVITHGVLEQPQPTPPVGPAPPAVVITHGVLGQPQPSVPATGTMPRPSPPAAPSRRRVARKAATKKGSTKRSARKKPDA